MVSTVGKSNDEEMRGMPAPAFSPKFRVIVGAASANKAASVNGAYMLSCSLRSRSNVPS